MVRLPLAAALAALVVVSQPARAIEVGAGTGIRITARSCIPGDTSICDGLGPVENEAFGGTPGGAAASASAFFFAFGGSTGSVALSGVAGAPTAAVATSSLPARVSSNLVAVQRYTYTGSSEVTRTFRGTLTYSQSLTGDYPAAPGIFATIALLQLSTRTFDVGDTAQSNYFALFDLPIRDDAVVLGDDVYESAGSTPAGLGRLAVTVNLTPGETLFVYALLQTPVAIGSSVDASHTFITGWDDASNLAAAVTAVPEPASWLLLAVGAAVVVPLRRGRLQRC